MDLNSSSVTEVLTTALNVTSRNVTFVEFIEKYRDRHFVELIAYLVLFGIGLSSNSYVFHQLMLPENRNNRMNSLLRHLTFADLMVIFIAMMMEIFERTILVWYYGNFMCKFMNMFKIFTLYSSSNIIVCIALDRYFAFVRPLSIVTAEERNKQFLIASYCLSLLQSLPQVSVLPSYSYIHLLIYNPNSLSLSISQSCHSLLVSKAKSRYGVMSISFEKFWKIFRKRNGRHLSQTYKAVE